MKIRWIFQPFKDLPSPCIPRSKYSASGPFMHFENFKVNLQKENLGSCSTLTCPNLGGNTQQSTMCVCSHRFWGEIAIKERTLKRIRRDVWWLGLGSKNEWFESNSLLGVPLSTQWDPSGYYYPTQVGIWWLFCTLNHKKGVVCFVA